MRGRNVEDAVKISIHAPRKGSDLYWCTGCPAYTGFQSTLPVKGATAALERLEAECNISIHAPRKGSDYTFKSPELTVDLISIHAPRKGSDRGGGD